MYLLDTNIFLEILFDQEKSKECKKFLKENINEISISDFTLHSIGVILFRYKKQDYFQTFTEDILSNIKLLNLPSLVYEDIFKTDYNLDFDDLYQYNIAKYYGMEIVTMDSDFKNISDLNITFL